MNFYRIMLSQSEIRQLIDKGEGINIEFKEAQNGIPDSFYDTVVSFLNKEGGIILLGLTDDGIILGLEEANLMQTLKIRIFYMCAYPLVL